jgi:hypothetical protein
MSVVMYDHRNTANSLTADAENTVLIFRSVLDLKRPQTASFQTPDKRRMLSAEITHRFICRGQLCVGDLVVHLS